MKTVSSRFPAGHYYSPVVDPNQVREYVAKWRSVQVGDIAGIEIDIESMKRFWEENASFIAGTPFTEDPSLQNRYYYKGGPYPYGDAITLRAIIGACRPRRMIEIGSGFSSACALDAAEHACLEGFRLTCIEPHPERLISLLRKEDYAIVDLFETEVQEIDTKIFEELHENDILLIDSSHVLKTGSDVHYELFHILPTLKPGVLVHFHDCRWPFEYPDEFIFDRNYSWNEAYAVRAFLMWNQKFKVFFCNGLFAATCVEAIKRICPVFLRNPGSSLWVRTMM